MIRKFFILALFIYSCSLTPKGKFGWYVQENVDIENLSDKDFINKHYTITNRKMIFKKNSIVSYIYKFESLPSKKEVTVSLNRLSLGYTEISILKKKINSDNQIWGVYKGLDVGKYQIQLSSNLQIFDAAEFEIVE